MILNIIGRDELPHLDSYKLSHLDLGVGGEEVIEINGVIGVEAFFVLIIELLHLFLHNEAVLNKDEVQIWILKD
jgi:hypothetical protein